jgi:hypothetical protein
LRLTLNRGDSMVLTCSCKHEFQDKKYGEGRRKMNKTKDGNYRCTVCGKERGK